MEAIITEKHFSTEEDALAEVKAAGYFPMTLDIPATTNENHWHDFDTMLFMLEGALTITEASGDTCTLKPGDRSVARAGVIHRETHDGFKGVFGFSVDPESFTMPIDKPPVEA